MNTLRTKHLLIACTLLLSLFGASCKKSSDDQTTGPIVVTGIQLTNNSKFGSIITDNNGRSLYFFAIDANGSSGCTNGCLVAWPAFYKENPSVGTGLLATDFSVITRADGAKQTTYKGWPLYYYAGDSKTGDTNGDAVDNTWFIAKADYTVMLAQTQLVGNDGANYTSQGLAGTEQSQYITDANGRTLYLFTRDTFKANKFSNNDATHDAIWPMFNVAAIQSIPSILDKSQFDLITVFGKTQLTYKGHPLYYFGQDNAVRGNTKGVSFPTPGAAVWKITNSGTVALTQ